MEAKTVNGNHPLPSQNSNNSNGILAAGVTASEGSTAVPATTLEPTPRSDAVKNPSKDEVGWYFVESYYSTLTKSPDTLHLYYNKRSQFVCGVEAEKVDVSVGQRAISERIKNQEFRDCKVRVSNVDAQETHEGCIVVSVIGELSTSNTPHRRFTQVFVLAEQPNGYFVLNDIFRYLLEEEEEPTENNDSQESAQALAAGNDPEALPDLNKQTETDQPAEADDNTLEQEPEGPPTAEEVEPLITANGIAASTESETAEAEDAPAAAVPATVEEPSEPVYETQVEPVKQLDPEPAPSAPASQPSDTAPDDLLTANVPPKPAAPKTWANLVAANRTTAASPAVPNNTSIATPVPPSQPKSNSSTNPRSSTPPASAGEDSPVKPPQNGNAGWQTAGSENNKKQNRQHSQSISNQGNVMAYIKNVTQAVDASLLKQKLLQYGKLAYYDVSRQKNCAFVEFEDQAAYNAAVAANPHLIGGEQIFVEERRPRSNAYGGNFANRGGMRGGRVGNDNRPGNQGRGGFPKDGGRSNFVQRGRGGSGNVTPRGRGQPQAA